MAGKLTKLQAYKVEALQELFPLDWKARSQHYKWFQETVVDKFLDPELVLLSDKAVV
jgi:hypothetical protein